MQSATPFHTLHGIQETAESRKMQALMEPRKLLPLPLGWGKRRRRSFQYD